MSSWTEKPCFPRVFWPLLVWLLQRFFPHCLTGTMWFLCDERYTQSIDQSPNHDALRVVTVLRKLSASWLREG